MRKARQAQCFPRAVAVVKNVPPTTWKQSQEVGPRERDESEERTTKDDEEEKGINMMRDGEHERRSG
jgi:hypothetical protein